MKYLSFVRLPGIFQPQLKLSLCNRELCFSSILSKGLAKISIRLTGLESQPGLEFSSSSSNKRAGSPPYKHPMQATMTPALAEHFQTQF